MQPDTYQIEGDGWERFRRRNLPHWEVGTAVYFVTFRLEGSLPADVAEEWKQEREALRRQEQTGALSGGELWHRVRVLNEKFDAQLDQGECGPRYLEIPAVAEVVVSACRFFEGKRYTLGAFVVMPNHAHVALRPLAKQGEDRPWGLDEIMHSLKSYTGTEANKLLGRRGSFWQREYYDHRIRSEAAWEYYVHYIHNNPVAAGLCKAPEDWPWSSASRAPVSATGEVHERRDRNP